MISSYWLDKVMTEMFVNFNGSFYIGLSSSMPDQSGNGIVEPSGFGYSRMRVASFSLSNSGIVSNSTSITFPSSTGTWFPSDRRAAYWCLFDGSGSSAKLVAAGALDTPRTIEAGSVVTVPENALSIVLLSNNA